MLDEVGGIPAADEVEVTVIGTGAGECILVHFGSGSWVVIDSCWRSHTKRPYALEYLHAIGATASSIRAVVATHWHTDHVRGLADVVSAAEDATFIMSGALLRDEFLKLIAQDPADGLQVGSTGVEEISKIVLRLRERGEYPTYASAGTVVWQDDALDD